MGISFLVSPVHYSYKFAYDLRVLPNGLPHLLPYLREHIHSALLLNVANLKNIIVLSAENLQS